jgi:hypothetical protein
MSAGAVNPGSRAALRAFIDRHLKAGGLAYISYNAMPGRAADLPLQTRHCSKRSPHPPADCPQQSRARAKSTSPDPTQAGTAAHSHGSAPVAR